MTIFYKSVFVCYSKKVIRLRKTDNLFCIEKKTVQKGIKSARFSWVVGGLQSLEAFIYKGFRDCLIGSNPPLPFSGAGCFFYERNTMKKRNFDIDKYERRWYNFFVI
jgi:hypothetical protein